MTLEAILLWKMTPDEASVYKLCLLWEKIIQAEMPNYRNNRLPVKSDPRKSTIFRHCWKLFRETKDFIPETDYKIYILAQIRILKGLSNGSAHALIGPACLCGPNAWKRWKMWKYNFDKQSREETSKGNTDNICALTSEIERELKNTKTFFESMFGKNYKIQQIEDSISSKEIVKWVSFKKVSSYYLIMSPIINKKYSELDDTFSIDTEILKKSISDESIFSFREYFPNEFQ